MVSMKNGHEPGMLSNSLVQTAILLALFIFLIFGSRLIEPAAVRTDNRPDQFDTARAFSRIMRILGPETPHPVDSDANRAVKDRLRQEVSALGFIPETSIHSVCDGTRSPTYIGCARVENISYRVGPDPAPGARDTLLLLAHYDSVPAGPGAGDDMIGVASILEISSHLVNQDIKRPVLVLITDGEETGLFGARAFVEQDSRFSEIEMVINFEARGVAGPAFMFETSQPNAKIVAPFIKAAKRPVANSTMSAVYEAMPNGTDLTEFINKSVAGLNFAIIRNERFYHTPNDNLENLSKRSLQHMGDLGLVTTRRLVDGGLYKTQNRILYTDILSQFMISLPQSAALPILLIGLMLAGFGLYRDRPKTSLATIALTIILPVISIISAGAVSFGIQFLIKSIRNDAMYWIAHGWATQAMAILVGFTAALAMVSMVRARGTTPMMASAGWFWFLLAGIGVTFALPGAAILFVLPAIIYLIAVGTSLISRQAAFYIGIIAIILTVILWASPLSLLGSALGYGLAFVLSMITALLLLPLMGLICECANPAQKTPASFLPLASALAGVIFFAILAIGLPKYSGTAPRHLNIDSYTDFETRNRYIVFSTLEPGTPAPPKALFDIQQINPPKKLMTGLSWKEWHIPLEQTTATRPSIQLTTIQHESSVRYELNFASLSADRISFIIPAAVKAQSILFADQRVNIDPRADDNNIYFRCHGQSCPTNSVVIEAASLSQKPWTIIIDRYGLSEEASPFVQQVQNTTIARQAGHKSTLSLQLTPQNK